MRVLFVLFVILPILEIWVLIRVGGIIGAVPTIVLVVLTAAIGAALLRQQGLATVSQAQLKMQQGNIPLEEIVAGIFLAVGGALLLTPGFITDVIGFCCLIPGLRKVLLGWVMKHLIAKGTVHFRHSHTTSQKPTPGSTIEGEFRRED